MKRIMLILFSLLFLVSGCAVFTGSGEESGEPSTQVVFAKKELVGEWIATAVVSEGEEIPMDRINAFTTFGLDFSHDRMVRYYTLTDGLPSEKTPYIFTYDETTGELVIERDSFNLKGNISDGILYLDSPENTTDPGEERSNLQLKFEQVQDE